MFILSVISVIISSYILLSVITGCDKKKPVFLYFILLIFAQIVLTFEGLSLLNSISPKGVLISNAVFLVISVIIFIFKKGKFYIPQLEVKKIINALKRDKMLLFLFVCFVFFIIFQLIQIFCFPIIFGDALTYYLPRCTTWIQQGNIAHFVTPDTRELVMPVNMEFLYTWLLLFKKSEIGAGIFSFIGYIGAIYVIYQLLRELNFSIRRCLWSIFVVSSFALVIVEMTTPCADLFIGGLISASIYLFLRAVKYTDKTALYFSSLAYALAVGTKTTAIIAIPSVFIIFLVISIIQNKERENDNSKPKVFNSSVILQFGFLFISNFLIFASYNYILNILQFGNPVSCSEQLLLNKFNGGVQGYLSTVIKYVFAVFDMSGMPKFIDINGLLTYWQTLVLALFGTAAKIGSSNYFPYYFEFNNKMGMAETALGIMGLFVFLPSVIYSVKRLFKNKKSKTAVITGVLALSIVFNILLFARVMVFTGFNMRYLLTFVVIAAPVVVYSYPTKKHKFCRIFLCLLMFLYLIGYPHQKAVSYILACLNRHSAFVQGTDDKEIMIYEYFKNKNKSKIGLITDQTKSPVYYLEKLKLTGFKVEKILPENIEDTDLSGFDYIITALNKVSSTNIVKFPERLMNGDIYASRCIYNDYRQDTIYLYDKNHLPAMVECEIPFDYIYQNGFAKDENFNSEKYIILYNKK